MELSNGYDLPLFGKFVGYNGYKDKSSKISLIPNGGILRKEKKRSKEKAIHEILALGAWEKLLKTYNKQTDNRALHIVSPRPFGIDENGNIYMEFMAGMPACFSMAGNYMRNENTITLHEARLDLSRRIGRLLRIKEIEKLAHFDFQLRHLLHDINNGILSVIDVENSRVDSKQVKHEHLAIRSQINSIFSQSTKNRKKVEDAISEGYESEIDSYPVLLDVAEEIRKELGFHEKQIQQFLK